MLETRLVLLAALSVFRTLAACGVGACGRAGTRDDRGDTEGARHCAALLRGAITRLMAEAMGLGMDTAISCVSVLSPRV